jgi:hypothetical protein
MKQQYIKSELDKVVKETVRETVDSITPPPLEESWARFEKKLQEQEKASHKNKRKSLLFKLAASAGVIIVLTGALAISSPGNARAIGEKILHTVETLLGGTQMNVKTSYRQHEPGQLPLPQEKGFSELPIEEGKIVSLEEAKKISPFPVLVPRYIPAGYTLDRVEYQPMTKPVVKISLLYKSPNADNIVLEEMNVPDGYVQGYGYDIEDAVTEDITVGKNSGQLILFKNERIRMTWINNSVLFTLDGRVSKEEAIKIAESVK